jgi:predicted transcriptional regulator
VRHFSRLRSGHPAADPKGFSPNIESSSSRGRSTLIHGWYNNGMKEKTSITLSKEVLAGIDRIAGSKQSRSAFIEAVLAQYLRKRARAQVEARDLELINQVADELNTEVEDILRYQDADA